MPNQEYPNYLTAEDLGANEEIYDLLARYRLPDGWETQEQLENFERLAHISELSGVPIKGASCLDVGCGTGAFADYWRQLGGGNYYGVDIYGPAVASARHLHPAERFEQRDILAGSIREGEMYDFVFCSGAFSVQLASRDNYAFLKDIMGQLTQMARHGVAFNFLTDTEPNKIDGLFFYNPQRVTDLCGEANPDFTVSSRVHPERNQAETFLIKRK